jgi:hypothetical protein
LVNLSYLQVTSQNTFSGPGMIIPTCKTSYLGGGGKRSYFEASQGKTMRYSLKNKTESKRMGAWLKW